MELSSLRCTGQDDSDESILSDEIASHYGKVLVVS